MSVKNCCYKGCKNDSRYSDRDYMEGIFFLSFPKPKLNLEKCKRWMSACARPSFLNLQNVTRNRFICSFHFLGGVGPTENNPDPVPYHEYCADDTHVKCINNIEILKVHSEELYSNSEQPSSNPKEITAGPKEPSMNSEEPINAEKPSSKFHLLPAKLHYYSKVTQICPKVVKLTHSYHKTSPKNIMESSNIEASNLEVTPNESNKSLPKIVNIFSNIASNEDGYFMDTIKEEPLHEEPIQIESNNEGTILPVKESYGINNEVVNEENDHCYMNITQWPSIAQVTTESERLIEPKVPHSEYNEPTTQLSRTTSITTLENSELEIIVRDYLTHQINNLDKIQWFLSFVSSESCKFQKMVADHKFLTLEIKSSLAITISLFGKPLPHDHPIYTKTVPVLSYEQLLNIMYEIDNWRVCNGITGMLYEKFRNSFFQVNETCGISNSIRSKSCFRLQKSHHSSLCEQCRKTKKVLQKREKRDKIIRDGKSIHTNKRYMTNKQILQHSQLVKKNNSMLKRKIKGLRNTILKIKNKFSKGFLFGSVENEDENREINPFEHQVEFQKLMLREQYRILNSNKTRPRKWHPAIVEWAHFVKTDAPASYEIVKQALSLPCNRTLQKYSKHLESLNSVKDNSKKSTFDNEEVPMDG